MQRLDISDNTLTSLLDEYKQLADSNPFRLRKLLPADDVWRFFVEKSVQQNGRNLKKVYPFSELHTELSHLKKMTLSDYIRNRELLVFPEMIGSSKLHKTLKAKKWTFPSEAYETLTLEDMLLVDKGWIPFETNEPGYFASLYDAFDTIFDFTYPFNLDWILKLHTICMRKTHGTNYDSTQQMHHFRNCFMHFGLAASNTTQLGLQELLDKTATNKHAIGFSCDNIYIEITPAFLKDIRDNYFQLRINLQKLKALLQKHSGGQKEPSATLVHAFRSALDSFLGSDQQFTQELFKLICEPSPLKFFYRGYASDNSDVIQTEMAQLLKVLEDKLAQTTLMEEKLKAMVQFTHECAIVHPLRDGNTRTLYTCMFNHLLMQHGFPLCLLDNFNIFEGHTVEELYAACLHGMQNTFELIKKGKLFGLDTGEIKKELQDAHLGQSVKYMDNLAQQELHARTKLKSDGMFMTFTHQALNNNADAALPQSDISAITSRSRSYS